MLRIAIPHTDSITHQRPLAIAKRHMRTPNMPPKNMPTTTPRPNATMMTSPDIRKSRGYAPLLLDTPNPRYFRPLTNNL